MFWRKVEKNIQERHLFGWTLLFSPVFFFFKSNMNRSKRQKKKVILRNILSGNLTINLLINFAFFVLSKGVSIKVEVASRFE